MSLNLDSHEMRKVDMRDVSTVAYLSPAFYLISFAPRRVVDVVATTAGRFGLDYEQMPEDAAVLKPSLVHEKAEDGATVIGTIIDTERPLVCVDQYLHLAQPNPHLLSAEDADSGSSAYSWLTHLVPRRPHPLQVLSKLADYVISILDELHIDYVTFWGWSSGGAAVLALAADYPERMRNGLPHEAPTAAGPQFCQLIKLAGMEDEAIVKMLGEEMPQVTVGHDLAARHELGEEAHARLRKNYPRWARGYPHTLPLSSPPSKEDLTKRPLDWTVGGDTPTRMFFDNIVTARKAGIFIGTLPGTHALPVPIAPGSSGGAYRRCNSKVPMV
ncbi:hypothetical protein DL766_004670 [Monosporascus sp. MC13-8B]|uniref:AB hydrolase-1 domain-containing protein n=1 Tax=Monosporascus cannonballus TaxID=155416 RepID=A0ABY0HJE1_9PEZI|nr:hypothetical protein DL763_010686 [Monosporascus cannonballus]RYO94880.1 hypothetical protein DL762_000314 [Monosporascus cannonballus]RYP30866.1 hypothetical protein DL766_004670 [Monosporascus sp. MC13-8B]